MIFEVPDGRLYESGVMMILFVPAMTPDVDNVAGGAMMAAYAAEHVYWVVLFNVYVTTEKH